MSEATVTVTNTVAAVVVENTTTNASVTVAATDAEVVVVVEHVGIQGPPGDGGDLNPDFIIDGGNF